jgi:hypothetical protein
VLSSSTEKEITHKNNKIIFLVGTIQSFIIQRWGWFSIKVPGQCKTTENSMDDKRLNCAHYENHFSFQCVIYSPVQLDKIDKSRIKCSNYNFIL